ncbi:hypothetical protein SK128_017080 [Halocaridina rubra]|uniref:Uncharacterized protein n=1 Tax=Halocaridina rubra TaxID=373956 RepID=A0AAN8WJ53_HALRR
MFGNLKTNVQVLYFVIISHICSSIQALYHHQGCIVGTQKEIPWPWLEGEVGLWIEGDPEDKVFEIHLNSDSLTQTLIITRSSARWSSDLSNVQEALPEVLEEGWNKFELQVTDGDLTLSSLTWHTSRLLLELTLAKPIQQVQITGSNVSMDCFNDRYSWIVPAEGIVAVPFVQPEGRPIYLQFFSQEGVKPVLSFRNMTSDVQIHLGWNGENICPHADAMPLPNGIYHNLTLFCEETDNGVNCYIKNWQRESEELIYNFELTSRPNAFSVESTGRASFLLTVSNTLEIHETTDIFERRTGSRTKVVFFDSTPSSTGAIISLTIAVTIIVIVLVIRLRKIWKKKRPRPINTQLEEGITLMDSPPPSQSYAQFQAAVAYNQQNACMVAGYDQTRSSRGSFRSLFNRNSKRLKDITMEIHKRGDKQCLMVINNHFEQDNAPSSNSMILKILKEYEEVTRDIFKAALAGHYEGAGGVKGMLVNNSLPGTIQDQYGRSLLHYVAFAKGPSREPLWMAEHIKDLVKQHNCNTRAVDFTGQNPLHTLVRSCTNSQAWLHLANMLVDLGCDPQQKDYQGKTASENIVDNQELATIFAKEIKNPSAEMPSIDLATACSEGDLESVAQHLRCLPSLRLSLAHPDNLLSQAVKGGHRDLMLLLLSAGESILRGCVGSTTVLEFAHTTDDTPAIFPAILRKVFCDSLTGEINKIPGYDLPSKTLRTALKDAKRVVYREGFDAMILCKLPKDRHLLCEAAKLGLSVTCQLLAMGGSRVVALRHEDHLFTSAVRDATVLRENMLYTIVNDLKNCPYSTDQMHSDIPADLQKNMWARDMQLLDICGQNSRINLATEVDGILRIKDETTVVLSEDLVDAIVQHNLFSVLNRLKREAATDFKSEKYQSLGKSLLATAVVHNNVSLAEYLLFQEVNSSDIKEHIFKTGYEIDEESNSCLKYILQFESGKQKTEKENNEMNVNT